MGASGRAGTLGTVRIAVAIVLLGAAAAAENDPGPLFLLVSEPKPLDLDSIAAAAERAFGVGRAATIEQFKAARGTSFHVSKEKRGHYVRFRTRTFVIHQGDEPVLDADFAWRQEPEIRRAVLAHRGFIEVTAYNDIAEMPKLGRTIDEIERTMREVRAKLEAEQPEVEAERGRLCAEFFDRKPTAYYIMGTNWIYALDEQTRERLRSARPFAQLCLGKGIPVEWEEGGPAMEAAERKARANWFRFVGAFGRHQGDRYRVLITLDEAERSAPVWLWVRKADSQRVTGTIVTEPITLLARAGKEVTVDRSEVRDWAFVERGESVGGYTLAVREKRRAAREQAASDGR